MRGARQQHRRPGRPRPRPRPQRGRATRLARRRGGGGRPRARPLPTRPRAAPGAATPPPAGAAARAADTAEAPGGRRERSGLGPEPRQGLAEREAARGPGAAGGGDAERRALQAAVFAHWRAAAARASAERVRRSASRERARAEPSEPMPSALPAGRAGGMWGPDGSHVLTGKRTSQRDLRPLGLAGWSLFQPINAWCHHTSCACWCVERVCPAMWCALLHQPPRGHAATAGAAGMHAR